MKNDFFTYDAQQMRERDGVDARLSVCDGRRIC